MGKEFIDGTLVVPVLTPTEKWDFMKVENFCTANLNEEPTYRMEKIFLLGIYLTDSLIV